MKLPKITSPIKQVAIPKSIQEISGKFSTFLLPAVATVVIFLLLFVIVRPRIGEIFKLRGKIASLKLQEKALAGKLAVLRSFDEDLLLADTRKVEIALPSEKDLPGLLAQLERMAVEAGVKLIVVQSAPGVIAPEEDKSETNNFPVKITIEGNFFQIKSFFASIFTSTRLMEAKNLSIVAGKGEASLSASFALESFFQPLEKVKFTISDPLPSLTAEEKQILAKIIIPAPIVVPATPSAIPITGKPDPFVPF